MAESYSVKARLSATDSGFSSTLKSALGSVNSLAGRIKSGFAFGILAGAGQQAFRSLTSGVSGLISEVDSSNAAWKTFTGNMEMLGQGKKEINSTKKELQKFAQQTVYSASDMATTYSQLAAVGTKNTKKLVKGFGGLAAAAENPQQAMKTLSQQATQMAAKPQVAWQDFKLMLEQTPAGIAAVAKEMGMSASELVTAVQDGKVSTEEFFDAIQKVGTNKSFSKLATEYKTVGQAMDGLKETVGNKLTPAFDVLSKKGIGAISAIADKLSGIDAQGLADKISSGIDKAAKYWEAFKSSFSGVGTEVSGAFKAIGSALSGMTGEFGSAESVDGFKSAMQGVANVIKSVAGFAKQHSKEIATLIKYLPAIVIGIKGFGIAKAVLPGVVGFTKGIAGLASKGIGGIASKLFGISGAQKKVGKSSANSGKKMLTAAKSFALMGVAVLLIAAGFALLAFSAIQLANAGPLAIGVMAGLVVALAGFMVGMAFVMKMLAPMSGKLISVGVAFLALGAAVLLIGAGFTLLAQSAIALAAAGWPAIAMMGALIAIVALLAIGAAALGPALTIGAVGFIAFGAAIALVGIGALLAAVALQLVAGVLPTIVAYGLQGAVSILALGAAMLVFGTGAMIGGAGAVVLGAGFLVAAVGTLALGVAILALGIGLITLAGGSALAAGGLSLLALVLPMLAVNAMQNTIALAVLSAGLMVFALGATSAGVASVALGAGLAIAAVGVVAFGVSMLASCAGVIAMALALKGVNSKMKTIGTNAKSAEQSLISMKSSVKVVEAGLDALGSKAKSAMNSIKNAFDNTAAKAQSTGKKVGTGFSNGMKNSLSKSTEFAKSAVTKVNTTLLNGKNSAYNAGAYISKGFANGMLSCLNTIRNAATQMAAQADKAVRAKLKIHSPSRVAEDSAEYYGIGFVNKLKDMQKKVWSAAQNLVTMPQVETPNLAMSYSGAMVDDYEYYRNAQYTIVVPVEIDGKEVARTTAPYTEAELDKRQTRNSRKHGRI